MSGESEHVPSCRDRLALETFLRRHLFEAVLPFWEKFGFDPDGGLVTCIADDGAWLSREKWMWSQWRAVWVFSRIFRTLDPDGKWLAYATHILKFALLHGWDSREEGWKLCVDDSGRTLRGTDSLYVDGFAIYALAEYLRATGDEDARRWLVRSAESAARRIEQPHDQIPLFPYPVPSGSRVHGLPMIFSLSFGAAAQALSNERYRNLSRRLSAEIKQCFFRPEWNCVVERVRADGSSMPAPLGTAVVPGHVIECAWFQLDLGAAFGASDDQEFYLRQIRRHFEMGWDQQHGGILLAVDARGGNEVGWDYADMKLWWPHTEALYALLRADLLRSTDGCFAQAYDQVMRYAMDHFPDEHHGEWRQKLSREGRPVDDVVALPVKDPFHLPRSLILQLERLGNFRSGDGPTCL